jgi:hypothetical protein
MWNLFNETGNAFKGGFVGGAVVLGGVVFSGIVDFAGEYIVKLGLVGIGAVVSGLGTALGKHIFDHYKKKRNDKRKQKELERARDRAA